MDTVELGRKIKEARIAKKMTQSQVVGDFITRNMLSQIESGAAAPSVKTLEYLSKVLDLSLDQLIPGPAEDILSQLSRAKELLRQESFQDLIDLAEDCPVEIEDEMNALLAKAYLEMAEGAAERKDYPEAAAIARKAIAYAEKGIYANRAVKTEAALFLNDLAERLRDYYASMTLDEEPIIF